MRLFRDFLHGAIGCQKYVWALALYNPSEPFSSRVALHDYLVALGYTGLLLWPPYSLCRYSAFRAFRPAPPLPLVVSLPIGLLCIALGAAAAWVGTPEFQYFTQLDKAYPWLAPTIGCTAF